MIRDAFSLSLLVGGRKLFVMVMAEGVRSWKGGEEKRSGVCHIVFVFTGLSIAPLWPEVHT